MVVRTHKMGERHEQDAAAWFGWRRTAGSGNQWRDPADGRQAHGSASLVFAGDCKSTLGKSLSISLDAWDKLRRQSTWARPLMPLRWWADERCTRVRLDLVAMEVDDARELMEALKVRDRARELAEMVRDGQVQYGDQYGTPGVERLARDLISVLEGGQATEGAGLPDGGFPEEL